MNTPKRAKEVANRRPDTFNAIRMNFANTIGIVISCPFTVFMTDHDIPTIKTVISTPTICVDDGISGRELMHMIRQYLFVRVRYGNYSDTDIYRSLR